MIYLIFKRRLITGIWLAGVLTVVVTILFFAAPAESVLKTMMLIVTGFAALLLTGCSTAYYWVDRNHRRERESYDEVREERKQATARAVASVATGASYLSLLPAAVMLCLVIVLAVVFGTMDHGRDSVFSFIETGDVSGLSALLDGQGGELNEVNGNGLTPLMLAVLNGRQDMAECLLSHGAAVNHVGRSGYTALFYAMGDPALFELLLAKGADPNRVDVKGMSMLHTAVKRGASDCVRLLLQYGALVNVRDREARTPLFLAVESASHDVELLLMHGADPDIPNQLNETPLHYAAMVDNAEIATALLEAGAEANAVSLQGWAPVHVAALNGSLAVLDVLSDYVHNMDLPNKRSQTPLSCAVLKNQSDAVEYFLERGADIFRVDRLGNSYLHLAVANHHEETAKLLIEAGADLDLTNNASITPREMIESFAEDSMLQLKGAVAVQEPDLNR